MNKTQLIAAILAANCGLAETDREALNSMTDAQLDSLQKLVKEHPTVNFSLDKKDGKVILLSRKAETPATPPPAINTPSVPASPRVEAPPTSPAPVANAPKVVTVQEYIQQAPREVQDVLANAMAVHNDEKQKLITVILANSRNTFTKESLEARPLTELKAIASLAQETPAPSNVTPMPNYSGQAPVPSTNAQKVEALPLPTMNFDPPGRKKAAAV